MEAVKAKQIDCCDTENYFATENLGQIADIEGHLDFLEKIAEKYILTKQEQKTFNKILSATKRKQKDELLNMSIIGEFSGGKSTFINALLRNELLSSCSLQGTTVANTVIEYSEDYYIKLILKKGRSKKESVGSLDELRIKVDEYTTDPEFTKKLNSVEIGLPSDNIRKVFRIIDTPGTNSLELWHEEVTKNALRELSDVSVILLDSTKILPESFCNFVNENLEKFLPQCAFVLTKMDLIPEKEREMVVSYTRMKVENTFGLKDPLILPFSSLAVLDGDEENEMYKASVESEKRLLEFMAKKKAVAQLRKVIYFADMLYDTATESINAAYVETEKQLEFLMKSKQTDLSSFINEQKVKNSEEFLDKALVIEVDLQKELPDLATQARKNVIAKIDSINTLDNLKAYVNDTFSSDCQTQAQKIAECSKDKLGNVVDIAEKQMLIFQDEFKRKFEELSILDVDFERYKMKDIFYTAGSGGRIPDTKKYVSDELTKENTAFFGTAAAGALIGTTIAPVIGTAIGAVVGFFAGGFFRPDIEKVKINTKEKIAPALYSYISEASDSVSLNFKKQVLRIADSIEKEIDAYYKEYKDAVDVKIAEETNKRDEIKNRINSIKADMQEVRNRKHVLTSFENKLK